MKRTLRGSTGFTLIELLVVIIIIGILAAIAIPMFLGQRDKAKEAAVKSGIHSIQIGVQSFATDNNDTYPENRDVSNANVDFTKYVTPWPKNPWKNEAQEWQNRMGSIMSGTGSRDEDKQGNYTYTQLAGGESFSLIGYGKGGRSVIAVP